MANDLTCPSPDLSPSLLVGAELSAPVTKAMTAPTEPLPHCQSEPWSLNELGMQLF